MWWSMLRHGASGGEALVRAAQRYAAGIGASG